MCSELASQSVDETLGLTFTWHLEESANVRCPEPNHKNVSPLAFKKTKNRTCYSSKLDLGPFKPDSQDISMIQNTLYVFLLAFCMVLRTDKADL